MNQWTLSPEKYLTPEQVKQFRKTCEDSAILSLSKGIQAPVRDWAILDTILSAGLRVSEATALKIGDLFISHGHSEVVVRHGKGGKARTIQISADLKKHLKAFLQWKVTVDEPTDKDDCLFMSERKKSYTTRAIQKRFKLYAKKSGLAPHYSIHALRHSYATLLYKASGHNLRLVQRQLGHSSITTTMVYASVLNEDVEQAVGKLFA